MRCITSEGYNIKQAQIIYLGLDQAHAGPALITFNPKGLIYLVGPMIWTTSRLGLLKTHEATLVSPTHGHVL